MKTNQSISEALCKKMQLKQSNYEIRLHATTATTRNCIFLLKNKLPFLYHDESDNSLNRGLQSYFLLENTRIFIMLL